MWRTFANREGIMYALSIRDCSKHHLVLNRFGLFHRPLRRPSDYEDFESTADTTGTFDVHRCCEVSVMFSDVSITSKSHGHRWSRPMLRSFANHNYVF
jgi:hypothetical protein